MYEGGHQWALRRVMEHRFLDIQDCRREERIEEEGQRKFIFYGQQDLQSRRKNWSRQAMEEVIEVPSFSKKHLQFLAFSKLVATALLSVASACSNHQTFRKLWWLTTDVENAKKCKKKKKEKEVIVAWIPEISWVHFLVS